MVIVFSQQFSSMLVHRNVDYLPFFKNAVITIGTFDGVHTGHQQIIQQLKDEASRIRGESVIITFDPHPRKVLGSAGKSIHLINTLEEKILLLSANGIDHLVIVPFTEVFSRLTARQYVEEFLIEKFRPHTIIIGYDHRFGQGRKGDYHLLEAFSTELEYKLKEIPVHLLNAISVSSTRIREAIASGDITSANALLGYPFFFEGRVVEGNKLGRSIGYPTANLFMDQEEKLLPGDAVYVVEVELGEPNQTAGFGFAQNGTPGIDSAEPRESIGQWFPSFDSSARRPAYLRGMMNIGFRPTLGGSHRVIEVNIFDFSEDIYGRIVRVYVRKWLRGEKKFSGLPALQEQLSIDKEQAMLELSAGL